MDPIKNKIRKLLELAKSDNDFESSVAFMKAKALMLKHGLTFEDIFSEKERNEFEEESGVGAFIVIALVLGFFLFG